MLDVDEALSRILDSLQGVGDERVPVGQALGRVVAAEILAPRDTPPFVSSAMDGFAVLAADVAAATEEVPASLRVIGESRAGHPSSSRVAPGLAVLISTGAVVPEGADAVVQVEWTKPEGGRTDRVTVQRAVAAGTALRHPGEDVRKGETLLPTGHRLGPADVGLLAAAGISEPLCRRLPRVALLTTGDELVDPGQPLAPGQIVDVNRYTLSAQIALAGGECRYLGRAPDDLQATRRLIEQGLGADLLITSAGVSVSERDFVKAALTELGALSFWRVAMRPGKPLAFGYAAAPDGRQVPVLGLPGNPVSSMMTFEVFARPAIARLAGQAHWERLRLPAVLDEPLEKPEGLRVFARVRLLGSPEGGIHRAVLAGEQGSHVLSGVARANAILVIPESVTRLEAGTPVEAWWLGSEWGG